MKPNPDARTVIPGQSVTYHITRLDPDTIPMPLTDTVPMRDRARDKDLISQGLVALLAQERASVLAWAHTFLVINGTSFTGTVDHLRKIHTRTHLVLVQKLLDLEREVAATRRRLGIV